MFHNPLVSVITVAYNSGDFIREAIESVLQQKYANFEYIICDDNSTDSTWQIIQEYEDMRIRSFKNDVNIGEYANRNRGVELANGEFIIFIDGDDAMYPHALAVFLSYAELFPECAILIARDWDYRIKSPYKVQPADFFRFEFFGTSIMGNFTKLFFKASILKQERFPAHIRTGDSYMQLKIGQTHPVLIIPDGLTWWRRRSGNATLNLFKDNRHVVESTLYRLDLLDDKCPLTSEEIGLAKKNLYGIFLRLMFRLLAKGEFMDALFFFKTLKVPRNYWSSFFISRKTGFAEDVSGDKPLHSNRQFRTLDKQE